MTQATILIAPSILRAAHERARRTYDAAAIHLTVCRWRKQGLVCSTCSDLVEAADRAWSRVTAEDGR